MKKFTFKKSDRSGRWGWADKKSTEVKQNKKSCGTITEEDIDQWVVRLHILKDETHTDDNPNSDSKWITFKKRFKAEEEAREYLNSTAVLNHIETNFKLKLV